MFCTGGRKKEPQRKYKSSALRNLNGGEKRSPQRGSRLAEGHNAESRRGKDDREQLGESN